MARAPVMRPRVPRAPRAPRPLDPNKTVIAPPRIKPISTRVYGKGGTPYSSGLDMGVRGAGIGFGGFKPDGT
jgi:hypothetical protein